MSKIFEKAAARARIMHELDKLPKEVADYGRSCIIHNEFINTAIEAIREKARTMTPIHQVVAETKLQAALEHSDRDMVTRMRFMLDKNMVPNEKRKECIIALMAVCVGHTYEGMKELNEQHDAEECHDPECMFTLIMAPTTN